jgi:deoxyribodipyrimidine photo-lyase
VASISKPQLSIFWFRRDLRLEDNVGLFQTLQNSKTVLPIFIFDTNILDELPADDARLTFIHSTLDTINQRLLKHGRSLLVLKGNPIEVWHQLVKEYEVQSVYFNKDYEPYARERDGKVSDFLRDQNISVHSFKDQVIFEENEIVKPNGLPYSIYTPYKNKWLELFQLTDTRPLARPSFSPLFEKEFAFPSLESLGFQKSSIQVHPFSLNIENYATTRDVPSIDGTSYLSPHLRFGTVSPRQIIAQLKPNDATFLSELIWREFFMHILFHHPRVFQHNFKPAYDGIKWINNEDDFAKWCDGKTGYPMVDAGMRQLNQTGYMHNRVRMIAAGFLCKHLLIDWRWGEAYFAEKLLDYDLSANNGNWQWAAGTGCDAAPYFRIFNPLEQQKKFDSDFTYVKKWIPEFGTMKYVAPIVEHTFARKRAIEVYKAGIRQ